MYLHRANTALPSTGLAGSANTLSSAAAISSGSRAPSPRVLKPDFRENSIVEERDKSGRVLARYRCGRLLGRGGFAKCYEFTEVDVPSPVTLACKVIDRTSLQRSSTLAKLHTEIAIHKRMKHKNIVNFLKTFQDDWFVYILLEKCSNQTLMEVSKTRHRFNVPETQFLMMQSISAIQYMHDQYVIHRDLKLGNIMMDSEMNVKIGDFGLAAELAYDGERKRTICGTPNYIAPEILEGNRDGHSYEVDVWSLGVILYTLLVGEPPFQTSDVKTTYDRIKRCRYEFPPGLVISESGKELVHKILQSRPDKRPTLIDIRNDPFFKSPVPPTVAPITLFPDHVRRKLEREGYPNNAAAVATAPPPPSTNLAAAAGAPALYPTATFGSTKAQDGAAAAGAPLRPLWANQQAPTTATTATTTASGSARASPRDPVSSRAGAPVTASSSSTVPTALGSALAAYPSAGGGSSVEPPASMAAAAAAAAAARPRTGSLPVFGSRQRTGSAGAAGPVVGGWCAAPAAGDAKNSPRDGAAAKPTTTTTASGGAGRAAATTEDDDERHHLTAVHEKLHQTLLGTAAADAEDDHHGGSGVPLIAPTVWITDYADFSAKYGLAYKLSTGHTGVHFNDSTKMVWEPITGQCEYYARVKETIHGVVHAQDQRQGFVMDTFPETLNKKVTLIKYFKTYLSRARGGSSSAKKDVEVFSSPFLNTTPALLSEPNMVRDMVYVKRWILNPEAMIFRLSNKTIQVAFRDKTEVILSSESKVVTYTDATGRRRTMLLSSVASQSEEIASRLKYTRDILCKLINNREL